jgi:hypothetical protein
VKGEEAAERILVIKAMNESQRRKKKFPTIVT